MTQLDYICFGVLFFLPEFQKFEILFSEQIQVKLIKLKGFENLHLWLQARLIFLTSFFSLWRLTEWVLLSESNTHILVDFNSFVVVFKVQTSNEVQGKETNVILSRDYKRHSFLQAIIWTIQHLILLQVISNFQGHVVIIFNFSLLGS